eukprot:TRINITY_DN2195_c0_g2_i1.p1 TRINITY_DN2195_c0_g2~~TRINITY_DN2195_c0_g2_i1.p1  ORF type:complete len:516 (-),score=32.00 TRINITY_DN2195_c0_g2_i1:541-2088(-)
MVSLPYIIVSLLTTVVVLLLWRISERDRNAPPGPFRWPILGNMPQIFAGGLPHRVFAGMAQKYGRVITVWLGARRAIIVSSPAVAREVLIELHPATSHRPTPGITAHRILTSGGLGMMTCNWTPYLQTLRRIACRFFAEPQLGQWQAMRVGEVAHMCQAVKLEGAMRKGPVNLRTHLLRASFNTIMTMMFGMRFEYSLPGLPNRNGDRFQDMLEKMFEIGGRLNLADYIPILRPVDPQRIAAQCKKLGAMKRAYFEQKVEEHIERLGPMGRAELLRRTEGPLDLCDLMLTEEGPDRVAGLPLTQMLNGLLFGGSCTSWVTVEWALVELIRNPEVMRELRAELDRRLGRPQHDDLEAAMASVEVDQRMNELPYLDAVVKETMRMHPAAPLLAAHSTADSAVLLCDGQYYIPPFTMIFINAWALQHDPEVWLAPFAFRPERFLNGEAEGKDMSFLPFGTGFRACPARPLAEKAIRLMVGMLVHTFEWECPAVPDNTETVGLVVRPRKPLEAYVSPRR